MEKSHYAQILPLPKTEKECLPKKCQQLYTEFSP